MADLVAPGDAVEGAGAEARLGAALGLVLIGKWTGVIAPLFLQGGDRPSQSRPLAVGDAVFIAFAGLVPAGSA